MAPHRPHACHLKLVPAHLPVREDGAVRKLTRKMTEPAVVAVALYRELWSSALTLFSTRPGR
jgi:hypothetical protein